MSKMNTSQWGEYTVGDLFEIISGKGITKNEIYSHPGSLPAIQSGEDNYGCIGYIDQDYCIEKKYSISKGACLTVARSGSSGYVGYQSKQCVVGDSAKILEPKFKASKARLLFLRAILNQLKSKFAYTDKVTNENYAESIIRIPVTENGEPDWEFMEEYTAKKISTYTSNIQIFATIARSEKIEKINVDKWGKFVVGELFPKIIKPDVIHAKSVSENDGGLAYVVRSKFNNGIKCKVSPKPYYKPSPAGTISFGAENATFFYQPQEYISGRDIYYIDTRHLSKEVCLFLTTCLQTIAKQYSYNNGLFPDLLKKETIWLPITAEGKPDWNYMENTIRNLMHNSEQYIKAINYA